ncbi:DNA polymerase III subunit psi [Pragia fontium]|uniref:DNA polymerase III subunit psi n=2 Tax=Pragia fontium TaxID=82985 RepID=A0AAJ4W7X7_9GAMM|nr:DNA polymerase III subunit psi [Pragia fontium]GKX62826.1 DNA polymerase III subunit psi [Pragia fontium]SFC06594.1 DNA polymerase III, psi subunit [Pragia fontium DSM 5563 = ATCC 49100]VEJ53879.1 DNA polymerase III subunit psi [Pragia fontium]
MATSRRDWQLEQMGIKQYQLRRPTALHGEVAIVIPDTIKLVLLSEQLPALSSPLMLDILRAMQLTSEQVYALMPEQAMMIPENIRCVLWLIGLNEPPSLPTALAELPLLTSPSLAELANDPDAKRILWQQICRDEYYFFPHSE